MMTRRIGARLCSAALVATALVGACGEKKGALILAINTDMKAPKDVNAVSVTVSTNGAIKHSFIGRVTPQGDVLLPATLAIVEPEDANASIRIRVMAFQERKPRVLRDVRTTVPREGRTALLRIPLNFVNDGSTKSAPLPDGVLPPVSGGGGGGGGSGGGGSAAADFDFFGAFQPECPDVENQTFIDGECKDNFVDPAVLPEFDEALVGSGASGESGACFQVATCFQGAGPLTEGGGTDVPPPAQGDGGVRETTLTPQAISLDRSSCTLSLNGADPSQLNLAIVTPDTGECVKEGECYVPLDQGASGWRVENGRVQLPPVVCKLLGRGLRLFQASGRCRAKTEAQPICRPKPPSFRCANPTFDACGKCLETNCRAQTEKCFGPDFTKGTFGGVCKVFGECFCSCTDTGNQACGQCEKTQEANGCDACLQANVEPCLKQNNCPCGNGRDDSDGGPGQPANTASVHLTFTPGSPPPQPSPGTSFDATMGQSSSPVPGSTAVQTNGGDGLQGFFKVEWCNGTFTAGRTFTQFSRGPGCINGNPVVELSLPSGAHWVSGLDPEQAGSMRVEGVNPLYLIFQGVKLGAQNGQTQGTFTVNGGAQWFNVTSP